MKRMMTIEKVLIVSLIGVFGLSVGCTKDETTDDQSKENSSSENASSNADSKDKPTTVTLSLAKRSQDDCPITEPMLIATTNDSPNTLTLRFQDDKPLFSITHGHTEGDFAAGQIDTFLLEGFIQTVNQGSVPITADPEKIVKPYEQPEGAAQVLLSVATVAGDPQSAEVTAGKASLNLTEGTVTVTAFDPDKGTLSATFQGKGTCIVGSEQIENAELSGAVTVSR